MIIMVEILKLRSSNNPDELKEIMRPSYAGKRIVSVCGAILLTICASCSCPDYTTKCCIAKHEPTAQVAGLLSASEAEAVAYCARLLPDSMLDRPICRVTVYSYLSFPHRDAPGIPSYRYAYGIIGGDDGYGLLSFTTWTGDVLHAQRGPNVGPKFYTDAGIVSVFAPDMDSDADWKGLIDTVLSDLSPPVLTPGDPPFLSAVQVWRIASRRGYERVAQRIQDAWRLALPGYLEFLTKRLEHDRSLWKFGTPDSLVMVVAKESHDAAQDCLFGYARIGTEMESRLGARVPEWMGQKR